MMMIMVMTSSPKKDMTSTAPLVHLGQMGLLPWGQLLAPHCDFTLHQEILRRTRHHFYPRGAI